MVMAAQQIHTRRRARLFWKDNQTGMSGVHTDSRESPSMHSYGGEDGFSAFWWAEGNGACDCNRRIYFLGEGIDSVECGFDRFTIERLECLADDDSVIQTFDAAYFAEVSQ